MRRGVGLVVLALLVSGCTSGPSPSPSPPPDAAAARAAADQLATALEKKDLTPVTFADAGGPQTDALFQPLVRGMGPLRPQVDVSDVTTDGDQARATLAWRWTFPGVPAPWTYASTVTLRRADGAWRPTWSPSLLEPDLDGSHRLSQRRLQPARGELLGEDGDPIVEKRPVVRIGLDKANLPDAQEERSARRLARLVDIDEGSYVKLVAEAGPQAFVPAITFRAQDPRRPDNDKVFAIRGALPVNDDTMLPPTRDFAAALVGQVGPATAEVVDASGGAVVDGDQVGLSGLQKRYDQQMRGTPGVRVDLVPTGSGGSSPSPSPSGSPTPTSSPTASAPVFEAKPVGGKPLETTLVVGLQKLAERSLAKSRGPASLVAVRPSTGAVLALASNTATDRQPVANAGRVQPGSTFKVVSALALLRAGLKPSSPVDCPRTITVDGRTYENYDDYPASELGRIDLRTAFAQSCNTAFIGQYDELGEDDLREAAASLGVGTDYDVGFPAYFGSVPVGKDPNVRAEAIFGQGKDQVSPLAMALVTASVEAGRTVLPTLLDGRTARSTAKPLTQDEAAALKQLMRGVVTTGSGARLAGLEGPPVIAKTGTAEYGSRKPPKTHAWMIAGQGDLAVAVFVQDGASGSGSAGPLLESFLRGAR
ncbi:penicillin-binding transpeptidase domain-containing protein [Microlunatus flavus]|uniref:Beta-lactamase n=1 Tax=Microlunatus flavus TaxID=1036181 RepID=A0A1H9DRC5_9ACTN|nr:penicillin-binding transpeptidase domain-containing protein [Microlunatus flavus]SEQ16065.1 Cell division protein FtsI/penicillin-binding protein 2 [Microlunatus flavus]